MAGENAPRPFAPSRIPPRRKPGERRRVVEPLRAGGSLDEDPELLGIRMREIDDATDDTPPTAIPSAFLIALTHDDDDPDEVPTLHVDRAQVEAAERRRRLAPPPPPAQRAWVDVAAPAPAPAAPAARASTRLVAAGAALVVVGVLWQLLR